MEFDDETLKKVAETCRLKLSEEEAKALKKDLQIILEQFKEIQKAGEGAEEGLYYVNETTNELREDEVKKKDEKETEEIVKLFSKKDGRFMVAPKSLE